MHNQKQRKHKLLAQSANASYGTEFATETDVHAVKKQNAQSEAKKAQASGAKCKR